MAYNSEYLSWSGEVELDLELLFRLESLAVIWVSQPCCHLDHPDSATRLHPFSSIIPWWIISDKHIIEFIDNQSQIHPVVLAQHLSLGTVQMVVLTSPRTSTLRTKQELTSSCCSVLLDHFDLRCWWAITEKNKNKSGNCSLLLAYGGLCSLYQVALHSARPTLSSRVRTMQTNTTISIDLIQRT